MIKVAASVLAADIMQLGNEINKMELAGCDWIHVDVMDGSFVPNLSYGPHVVKALKQSSEKMKMDVHLMINEPEKYVKTFIDAGADFLTVHVEATNDPEKTLKQIKAMGVKTGITLKPRTNVEDLKPYLDIADMVLIMTVEPGFGGQAFMAHMLDKVELLRAWGYQGLIQVDGGITLETGEKAVEAGADVLVMGTALFCSERPEELVGKIHALA